MYINYFSLSFQYMKRYISAFKFLILVHRCVSTDTYVREYISLRYHKLRSRGSLIVYFTLIISTRAVGLIGTS